jgi:hypothetical protein
MSTDIGCQVCAAGEADSLRKRDRKEVLASLEPGDIFHATSERAPSLICLVTGVSAESIFARNVTSQANMTFDRTTGAGLLMGEDIDCTIASCAPLPAVHHNAIISLDRRYRLLGLDYPDAIKLDEAEKAALLFIPDFYSSYPLAAASD